MTKKVETFEEAFEHTMVMFIHHQSFYANLMLNCVKHISTDIPTMGVNVTDNVNLYINPHFFMSMTVKERISVLCHEALHILNNHLVRFKELEPMVYEKKDRNIIERIEQQQQANSLNQAGDFAIDEFLPDIPKEMKFFDKAGNLVLEPPELPDGRGGMKPNPKAGKPVVGHPCTVERLIKDHPNKKIEHNMNLEYYYEILKKCKEEDKKNGKGGVTYVLVDDHSLWTEGAENPEFVEEKVKQVVNRAIEASGGREAGNIPSNIQAMIDALFYKPLNWKGKLRQFSARATEVIIEESRSRRNRRFGILYAGTKSFPKLKMGACVDTSGSMSDESLCQVLAELIEISKNNVEIVLVEADCQVHNVTDFDAKKVKAFSGRGGTAYQPAIDKCLELNVDCIAYFGDFDTSDTPVLKRKLPFLWVGVDTTQKAPGNFGGTIYAKINKKK